MNAEEFKKSVLWVCALIGAFSIYEWITAPSGSPRIVVYSTLDDDELHVEFRDENKAPNGARVRAEDGAIYYLSDGEWKLLPYATRGYDPTSQ